MNKWDFLAFWLATGAFLSVLSWPIRADLRRVADALERIADKPEVRVVNGDLRLVAGDFVTGPNTTWAGCNFEVMNRRGPIIYIRSDSSSADTVVVP